MIETINELDTLDLLKNLHKQAVLAGSLEEFERIMDEIVTEHHEPNTDEESNTSKHS
ncbi:hypothetical protein KFU94_55750 [Chloroflexi bacterium TSY]|nr:hypothetical protein [Chloroflexi bacterium TSY]